MAYLSKLRTYNANLQLAELVSGANVHLKYNYSATQNNGRIQSQTDVISGETVTYTYDSLNRLVSASATGDPSGAWTQSFTYDGFGNLTQKAGTNAPNNAFLATNPANNQLTANGAQYDGNGNLSAYGTGSFAVSYSYDNENRLTVANASGTTETVFGYDASNQRVYQGTYGISSATYSHEQIYFYGADGKKLVVYSLQSSGSNVTLTPTQTNTWFAGRLLVPQDRLRSVGKYFPYGEDRYNPTPANPANDQEKFATYTRDSATGLDYAYQRYYYSVTGRFLKADPSSASGKSDDPQSWNRYSYVHNDPLTNSDPTGAFYITIPSGCSSSSSDYLDPFDLLGDGIPPDVFGSSFCMPFAAWGVYESQAHSSSQGAPQVQCDIQLYFQPAGVNEDPENHTYIDTIEEISGKFQPVQYFEAGPALKGTKTPQFTASLPLILRGQTWLDQLDVDEAHLSHAYNTTSTLEWQTGFSQTNCVTAGAIATNAARYPDGINTYGLLLGPNSNSFTHALLSLSGVTVPSLISADLTVGALGWSTSLKW